MRSRTGSDGRVVRGVATFVAVSTAAIEAGPAVAMYRVLPSGLIARSRPWPPGNRMGAPAALEAATIGITVFAEGATCTVRTSGVQARGRGAADSGRVK